MQPKKVRIFQTGLVSRFRANLPQVSRGNFAGAFISMPQESD
ncbi:hypothetical protein [Microcoleus sp. FACHB-672]|nr:hypothetical protein [Microcoleus sp. FACHB-672]